MDSILQTRFKKILKIQWGGEFERPLWVRRCSFVSKYFWSKDKDKDLGVKNQDQDQGVKDQDKDKDLTLKDKDQDKDLATAQRIRLELVR